MQTTHIILFQDSAQIGALPDQSVDLVVTSPPYPMIEMWDSLFAELNPDVGLYLGCENFRAAFEGMHAVLDRVWAELYRVMKEGAFACINIGDAVRTINNNFRLFANHSRVQNKFFELGFNTLPLILWRKQTNAPNKFMGSGMLPAGAYVTLEHEYILIFRKGGKRNFTSTEDKYLRKLSGYFWEERNAWFSDLWDFKGARQEINNNEMRSRSAAFPVILPFRLINMYSVLGDTVFDPFLGTGTTTLAAVASGRNSVGCEIDQNFSGLIRKGILEHTGRLNIYNSERINNHLRFVKSDQESNATMKYCNSHFGFPVMTAQEKELKPVFVKHAVEESKDCYRAFYFDSFEQFKKDQ